MDYTLKKSLGQHFLKDVSICHRIVDALQQHTFHQLLEVGPGGGALTKWLLALKHIDFKAVELDHEKVAYLLSTYPALANNIIEADFLKLDAPFEGLFTVIGNFPYNISSQILFRIIDWRDQVPVVIGMFQKEVALRVAANPNSKAYGILSVLVQQYYEVEYLFDVPPESFNPPPKVMSGVLKLTRKTTELPVKSNAAFIRLVKAAFGQRRKMLRNPLKPYFSAEALQNPIFSKRAEQLSLADFANLTFQMQ